MPRSPRYEAERRLKSAKAAVEHAETLLRKARITRDKAALDAVTRGVMTRTEVAHALGVSRAFISGVPGMPSTWSKTVVNSDDVTAA
jgi:hypothetical protein